MFIDILKMSNMTMEPSIGELSFFLPLTAQVWPGMELENNVSPAAMGTFYICTSVFKESHQFKRH